VVRDHDPAGLDHARRVRGVGRDDRDVASPQRPFLAGDRQHDLAGHHVPHLFFVVMVLVQRRGPRNDLVVGEGHALSVEEAALPSGKWLAAQHFVGTEKRHPASLKAPRRRLGRSAWRAVSSARTVVGGERRTPESPRPVLSAAQAGQPDLSE
jgi:hypothetical protein